MRQCTVGAPRAFDATMQWVPPKLPHRQLRWQWVPEWLLMRQCSGCPSGFWCDNAVGAPRAFDATMQWVPKCFWCNNAVGAQMLLMQQCSECPNALDDATDNAVGAQIPFRSGNAVRGCPNTFDAALQWVPRLWYIWYCQMQWVPKYLWCAMQWVPTEYLWYENPVRGTAFAYENLVRGTFAGCLKSFKPENGH